MRDVVMKARHTSTVGQPVHDENRMTGQRGIALLTVMLMLLILSILGIASITVTSMENRMAGFFAPPKPSSQQPIRAKAWQPTSFSRPCRPLGCCRPRL